MSADLIGKTVSHYRIVELLGTGGMGVVYKAEDKRLGRPVALKFISGAFSDDDIALRQFTREARTASSLNHPNICTIYEIDESGGKPFIAMELLRGRNVKQRLEEAPFRLAEILDVGLQITAALGAAHDHGIVHRDVKPANIFITDQGQAKLLDFGLAKRLSLAELDAAGTTGFTSVGRILGTTNYMSPERLRGWQVDHRCDLFSVGAVIYEMMTGRHAFGGASVIDIMEAILHEESPVPAATTGPWPRALLQIVERLLEKSPDDRFQSATALSTALVALKSDVAAGRAQLAIGSGDVSLHRASIAVLPFRNLGAEPDNEFFADGLAEELITALAKIDRLRVAARASTFTFKGRNAELREIGARLKVETVLTGSVRRAGQQLRVSCRLMNVADGRQIWTERYDREMSDVFAVQDDITRSIVEKLKLAWVDKLEPTRRYTDNRESYLHYLRGRFYWSKRYEGGLIKAKDEFQAAIAEDSGNALAYSGMADVFAFLGLYSLMPPRAAFAKAKEAADRALAVDETLPEGHTSLGLIALGADWNWHRAEVEFMRAVDLDKTQGMAHLYYSWLLALADRRMEALIAIKRAQDVDPLAPLTNSGAGWMHFLMRDYDQAIAECEKCMEVDANFLVGLYVMAMSYAQKRDYEQATPLILRATELSNRAPFYLGLLGQIYAETGRTADVNGILAELDERSKTSYVPPHCYVYIHTSLGDKDRAFEWQDKACDDGAPPFYFFSPAIRTLHDDPRHKAHIQRMMSKESC